MATVRSMTMADALSVVQRMRQTDRDCLAALLGQVEDEAFAVSRWQANGPAWCVEQDGRAEAIYGLVLVNAWTAIPWLVATDTMHSWRNLMRHARIIAGNVTDPRHSHYRHRVEATVMTSWTDARRFAHRLGLRCEGVRRGAGSRGEDLETWAIVGPARN